MPDSPHVVILGAGFSGVGALQEFSNTPLRVTLIDRSDRHAFLPLIYQVATNQLDPEHISSAAQGLGSGRMDFDFVQAEVSGVDLSTRQVLLRCREPIAYDYLLIGLGAQVNFFGTPGAQEHAFPLYTLQDAMRLKLRIRDALRASRANDGHVDEGGLSFAVTGGGATGVETAGALAELLKMELQRTGGPLDHAEVHVIEMADDLLTPFKPNLRAYAKRALEQRGVEVHLGEAVSSVEPDQVHLRSGKTLKAHTVIWAAGLQSSPIGQGLPLEMEKGRPLTETDLSLPGHSEVFLAGDMAMIRDSATRERLPQLGSVAQQSGRLAGENIRLLAAGRPTKPFNYSDKGTMAMIGRRDAVVQTRSGRTMTGRPAWLAWRAVHLMLLNGGEQKAQTLLEWGKDRVGRSTRRLDFDDDDTKSD